MSETTNIQAVEPVKEEKAYTLRALEAKDVFLMTKIIGAIGIKEFKDCFESDAIKSMIDNANNDDSEAVASVGVTVFLDIAEIVLNNLSKCEKNVYALLGNLSGMENEQIESLPMNTFFEMIIDVIQKEEFKDFIKVVSKLFK